MVRVALFIREFTLKGGFKAGWEGGSLMTKVEPKGWGGVVGVFPVTGALGGTEVGVPCSWDLLWLAVWGRKCRCVPRRCEAAGV